MDISEVEQVPKILAQVHYLLVELFIHRQGQNQGEIK